VLAGSGNFLFASLAVDIDINVFSKSNDLVFLVPGDYATGLNNFIGLVSYE